LFPELPEVAGARTGRRINAWAGQNHDLTFENLVYAAILKNEKRKDV